MANAKNKKAKKAPPAPLPAQFASLNEAGEFWDTHDSADYEENFQDVDCEVKIKSRSFFVSLDSDLYRKVSTIAQSKGVSAETLVNLGIQEKAA